MKKERPSRPSIRSFLGEPNWHPHANTSNRAKGASMKKAGGTQRAFLAKAVLCLGLVALTGVLAPSTAAADAETFANSCGVMTDHDMLKALAQRDMVRHGFVLRDVGNSAGVLHERCKVLAWTGRQPFSFKQERRQMLAGKASALRMETWVPDEGLNGNTWRGNFAAKIKALTERAREQFTEVSETGRTIALPTFSVEHSLGFLDIQGGVVKLRAFWWSASASSIVSMTARAAKGSPLAGSIKQIASRVVPMIH
jgi:hypothetical protein